MKPDRASWTTKAFHFFRAGQKVWECPGKTVRSYELAKCQLANANASLPY